MNSQKLRSFAILFLISVIGMVSTACTIENKTEVAQVTNKPVVTVNIPLADSGAVLGDNVTIQVVAIDTKGISRVELSIDGKPYATMVAAPDATSFSGTQSWTPETIGNHVIQAQAFNIDDVASDAVQAFIAVADKAKENTAAEAPQAPPTTAPASNDTIPTATLMPPTNTVAPPTNTAIAPTNTAVTPTDTPEPPTSTPEPTATLPTPPQPLPNIYSFSANKYTIDWNDTVTLQWALDGADWAHLKYEDALGATGEYGVVAPGSEDIQLTTTTTYTLIAHNDSGDTTAQIVINVNPLNLAPFLPPIVTMVPITIPTPTPIYLPIGTPIVTVVIPGP